MARMKRTTVGLLGALALAGSMAVAAPASAGTEVNRFCSPDASVTGSTNNPTSITFLAGAGFGNCGTLQIRSNYTHVGGSSWTSWKYGDAFLVRHDIKNAVKSEHRGTYRLPAFTSYR